MKQKKPSQKARLAELLSDRVFHCSNQMRRDYMGDPSRRVLDLVEDGYVIGAKFCKDHIHDGNPKKYILMDVKAPGQGEFVQLKDETPAETKISAPQSRVCCTSWEIYQFHAKDCPQAKIQPTAHQQLNTQAAGLF